MIRKFSDAELATLAAGLTDCGADGWLLFDFQGHNPIATRMLALGGLGSRRLFVLLRPDCEPIAVAHKIELRPLEGFPGRVVPYAKWEELHAALGELVRGKTVAMEISPRDNVPYLDRVPHGVVELIQSRFLPIGSTGDRNKLWQIPVCVRTDNTSACTLLGLPQAEA